ncbi:MAG: choice-of-anchor tandem repeat GloVer-containing protein [Candidatus Cybelea sp.]
MHDPVQPEVASDAPAAGVVAPFHRSPFHVLHAFDPTAYDGGTPIARLIEFGGKFYGTTWTGGAQHGGGTVFEIDRAGRERIVHAFLGGYSSTDGGNPYSGLTATGNALYGTTVHGGADDDNGTVFRVTPAGKEKVIHSFGADGDGTQPAGDLLAYKGVLYGTTTMGGHGKNCSSYCGTVFAITPSGSERIIHNFRNSDGAQPYGGLIEVRGMLYGTAILGGGFYGARGTAFALSPSGTFKRLHTFGKNGDGASPYGTLLYVQGALYGTTSAGGAHGDGAIFKLTLDGSESLLYSFTGYLDGSRPEAGLIEVNNQLVGTTSGNGGGCGCGTIFSVDLNGKEKTLYRLDGIHDGENPHDALLNSNGTLFGTAYTGGPHQFGTVFRLTRL